MIVDEVWEERDKQDMCHGRTHSQMVGFLTETVEVMRTLPTCRM